MLDQGPHTICCQHSDSMITICFPTMQDYQPHHAVMQLADYPLTEGANQRIKQVAGDLNDLR